MMVADKHFRKRRWPRVVCCTALALTLAGCGNSVKQALGLGKRSPDEFAVVKRKPLIIPPDYALRPPRPGAEGPQAGASAAAARATLSGEGASDELAPEAAPALPADGRSPGESALLERTGADAAGAAGTADLLERIMTYDAGGSGADGSVVARQALTGASGSGPGAAPALVVVSRRQLPSTSNAE